MRSRLLRYLFDLGYLARTIQPPLVHQFYARVRLLPCAKISCATIGGLNRIRRLVGQRRLYHGIGKS